MAITHLLTLVCWMVFVAVWVGSSGRAKRSTSGGTWGRGGVIRLVLAVAVALAWRVPAFHDTVVGMNHAAGIPANGIVPWTGVTLCALGIALAVWARMHLGRNWGLPMSVKENPELVTSGPYAVVRHPIYSGMLLAMLGSSLAVGASSLVVLVAFGAYFVYSARKEEGLMMRTFPDTYPGYRARTKALIP